MDRRARIHAVTGGANAALAVLLGAFGAHALRERISEALLQTWGTAVEYHLYHALGLFVVAFVSSRLPDSRLVRWAGWLMLAGIVLFSGSLYALSLTGRSALGAVAPFGGVSFVAAWVALATAVFKE